MIDAENSGSRLDPDLMRLRRELYSITGHALDQASIPDGRYELADRGDGILFLFHAEVSKLDIVDPLMGQLVTGLEQHNRGTRLDDWLRLRIALHAGDVRRDENGWGARELTHTFRLSEAEPVKRCLRSADRAQCVVVTSDHFYRTVIAHGDRSIEPAAYRPVDLALPEGLSRAWLHVPGYRVPPVAADRQPIAPATERSGAGGHVIYAPARDFNYLRNNGVVNNYDGGRR